MDVLSSVLQAVRLSGSLFFTAEMREPWCVESPPPELLGAAFVEEPRWVVLFHVVAAGGCHVELDDVPAVWLEAGDVLILPHADAHVMASAPGDCARPTPVAALLPEVPVREPCRLEHGAGSSTTTHLVCGYLGADERFAPLARSLPRLLCVRTSERGVAIEVPGGDVQAIDERSPTGRSLETSLRCAVDEATHRRAGALSMLARLSELFFVQVLRSYMEHAELAQEGWLAGLRDPYVGAALQLVHGRPEHPWTVEALGRAVGLSRSAFGERFTRLLGQPPMRYLAAWRMHVARNLMRDPRLGLADVAARVGYESEAAFHRAFKRDRGEPPAAWRRRELPHA